MWTQTDLGTFPLQGQSLGTGKAFEPADGDAESSSCKGSCFTAVPSMNPSAVPDVEINFLDVAVNPVGSKGYDLWITVDSGVPKSVVSNMLAPDVRRAHSKPTPCRISEQKGGLDRHRGGGMGAC